MSEDEAARLLTELDNQPDHLRHFVLLALHSGRRFGEIAKLHADDLDCMNMEIILPAPKLVAAARIKSFTFHCLRYSVATEAIDQAENIVTVQSVVHYKM